MGVPATEAALIVEANGVPAEWITVAESNPAHGFCIFTAVDTYSVRPSTVGASARTSRAPPAAPSLNLDYRLAPEHPFQAAVDDAVGALAFIWAHGPDGESQAVTVLVGGDSAGGGLTLSTLLAARERNLSHPTHDLSRCDRRVGSVVQILREHSTVISGTYSRAEANRWGLVVELIL